MAGSGREARRRRILEGGQDRLALITGRKSSLSPEPQPTIHDFQCHQPNVSWNEEEISSNITSSGDYPATKFSQDDGIVGPSKEEPEFRKSGPGNERSRPALEDRSRREPSSAAQKAVLMTSDAVLWVCQQIPINNVTSQQVSSAVAVTEHDRMLCALTMAILVVLSSAGFPIVGSGMFRGIILFRPLFLVLITNITLLVRRLLLDDHRHLGRGDKTNIASLLGDGYTWAEEAGRALELGLILQNVMSALFMDCSVYATIVVFGLSLFG